MSFIHGRKVIRKILVHLGLFKGQVDQREPSAPASAMVAYSLPYEAVLAAMTVSTADLVIWSGDPLEETSAADQVIIADKIIEMVSSQTL